MGAVGAAFTQPIDMIKVRIQPGASLEGELYEAGVLPSTQRVPPRGLGSNPHHCFAEEGRISGCSIKLEVMRVGDWAVVTLNTGCPSYCSGIGQREVNSGCNPHLEVTP